MKALIVGVDGLYQWEIPTASPITRNATGSDFEWPSHTAVIGVVLIEDCVFIALGQCRTRIALLAYAKAVALAVDNPSLIRRPLIEHRDGSVTVGFSKKIQELLG